MIKRQFFAVQCGLPSRISSLLLNGAFMQAFAAKGRFANMLRETGAHRQDQRNLLGTATHGPKLAALEDRASNLPALPLAERPMSNGKVLA